MKQACTSLVFLAILVAPVTHATVTTIRHAAVEWVLAVDSSPGRCFAKLSKSVADSGSAVVDCASDSVMLDCGGNSSGVRTFDLAMAAFQSGRLINVRVTDEVKSGNSCLASRVYMTRYRAACRSDDDDDDYDDDYCDDDDGYVDDDSSDDDDDRKGDDD